MAKSLGRALPSSLMELLSARQLPEKIGRGIVLVTVDAQGWPHPALLSHGEVVAVSPQEIRIALWPNSTTTGNLRRNARATLSLVDSGVIYYVKGMAEEKKGEPPAPGGLTRFSIRVSEVLADSDPEGSVTGGVTYVYHRAADQVLRDWEAVLNSLSADPI